MQKEDLAINEQPSEAACLIVHRSVQPAPRPKATIATAAGGAALVVAGVCVLLYLLRRHPFAIVRTAVPPAVPAAAPAAAPAELAAT